MIILLFHFCKIIKQFKEITDVLNISFKADNQGEFLLFFSKYTVKRSLGLKLLYFQLNYHV